MQISDIMKIYEKKKMERKDNSFSFVTSIFREVEAEYKKDASKRGKNPQQSWNSWSGKSLQSLLSYIVEDYIKIKYTWIGITEDGVLRRNKLDPLLDKVKRNIIIFYEEHGVVPDADVILYDKRNSGVIAVLSCKASLRERVAQAAYWKLKLMDSKNTENILYFLVSTDKDDDFMDIGDDISRNRIIVEFGEIDGAWIFNDVPEGKKVKRFEKIFSDLDHIFNSWNENYGEAK